MRKKESTATDRMREKKKQQREQREWEKKRNPEERERIDIISSWCNILIQDIQLLMYNSPSDLMGYCS